MLERKFAESLEKFLLHEPRKILLVNGARQITISEVRMIPWFFLMKYRVILI